MKASIIGSVFFAFSVLVRSDLVPLINTANATQASPFAHGPDDDGDGPAKGALKSASQTAKVAGLNSLVAALTKADLVATVDGLKEITIFAPNDAAFAKIASTAQGLNKEQLQAVLKYHVVKGVIKSTDLKNGAVVPTINGASVTVTLSGKDALINKSKVIKADVPFSGGIVHVIDAYVSYPSSMTAVTNQL